MINAAAIKKLKLTPGHAAAVTLFADLYSKNPSAIKKLLEKHDQAFTGNPNLDYSQFTQLIKDRGSFFNQDMKRCFNEAKYLNFDTEDLAKNFYPSLSFDPASQLFTTAADTSTGSKNTQADAGTQKVQTTVQLPPAIQSQLAETLAQNGPIDQRPGAQDLLNTFGDLAGRSINTATGTILGMAKKTFYIVLGVSVGVIILIVVTIVVMRSRNKNKNKKDS